MALSFKTGLLSATTDDTTDAVTGLGFQPKFVIFRAVNDTGTAEQANAVTGGMSVGFSDGTQHRVVGFVGDHNATDTNVGRSSEHDRCIHILTAGAPTVTNKATCAMNADGFTLTWDSTPAAAYKIIWEAYGGSDITNVAIGTATRSAATGAIDTNVGFVGNFAMFLSSSMDSEVPTVQAHHSVGFATDSTHECAAAIAVQDAQPMASNFNAVSIVRNDACLIGLTTGAAIDFVADFTTFDQGATGNTFRINFSDGPAGAINFHYLVVKGGTWNVGVSTAPASATTQTVSGLSVQPSTLGLVATQAGTLNTIAANAAITAGAADGTNEAEVGWSHSDTADPTSVQQRYSATKCMSATSALTGEADFTSFNSDGWTITWSFNPASVLVLWYAAVGTASGNATFTAAAATATALSPASTMSGTAVMSGALATATAGSPTAALLNISFIFGELALATALSPASAMTGGALIQAALAAATALSPAAAFLGDANMFGAAALATALSGASTMTGGATLLGALGAATALSPASAMSGGATMFGAAALGTALAPASEMLIVAFFIAELATATAASPASALSGGANMFGAAALGTALAPASVMLTESFLVAALASATAAAPASTMTVGVDMFAGAASATALALAATIFTDLPVIRTFPQDRGMFVVEKPVVEAPSIRRGTIIRGGIVR